MSNKHVKSRPYLWPWNGDLRPDNTVLIVIDMQTDFCGVGGYVDKMGYDLSLTRAPIEPIRRLLAATRKAAISREQGVIGMIFDRFEINTSARVLR